LSVSFIFKTTLMELIVQSKDIVMILNQPHEVEHGYHRDAVRSKFSVDVKAVAFESETENSLFWNAFQALQLQLVN
jgi:hypothetical protein